MNARSALFDLYGDHLRDRVDPVPVAGLVRALAALGITAPAVRTQVSRMVREGWLVPGRTPQGPGYALTAKASRRLDASAARIYRTSDEDWDGLWHLLVVEPIRERSRRDRVRAALGFLGYGALADGVWIAARPSPELDALLDAESVHAERFRTSYDDDGAALVRRVWHLDTLARSYTRWLRDARELTARLGPEPSDEQAFAVRTELVHGWRKFLFTDPHLPASLLPPQWAGARAAAWFDDASGRLLPLATRFVRRSLDPSTEGAR